MILLFVGLTASYSRHNSFYNSEYLKIHSSELINSPLSSSSYSLATFHGITFDGLISEASSSYYYFPSISIQDAYDDSFSDYLNQSYLPSFSNEVNSDIVFFPLSIFDINVSSSNRLAISQINFFNMSELNFSVHLNYDTSVISQTSSPSADATGTTINFKIYDNSSILYDSVTIILNQSDSSQSYTYSFSGETFKFYFEDSKVIFEKSSASVNLDIIDLKIT